MVYAYSFNSNASHNFTHIVKGKTYKIHILYDTYTDSYYMNIDKLVDSAFIRLIQGVRLTTGVNILLQYEYLGLGGIWVIPRAEINLPNIPDSSSIVSGYLLSWEHD